MDIELLRGSFAMLAERQPLLTQRFYEVLFARHPELRLLFGSRSQAAQEKMLTQALVAVLEHLDDPPWLARTLEALGAKHVGYGVTEGMYDWVGDALLATFEEIGSSQWSQALTTEWGRAYAFIAGAMQAGARKAAGASKAASAPLELRP